MLVLSFALPPGIVSLPRPLHIGLGIWATRRSLVQEGLIEVHDAKRRIISLKCSRTGPARGKLFREKRLHQGTIVSELARGWPAHDSAWIGIVVADAGQLAPILHESDHVAGAATHGRVGILEHA